MKRITYGNSPNENGSHWRTVAVQTYRGCCFLSSSALEWLLLPAVTTVVSGISQSEIKGAGDFPMGVEDEGAESLVQSVEAVLLQITSPLCPAGVSDTGFRDFSVTASAGLEEKGFICGFSVATGAAARLVSGYDSYGNICGQKNAKLEAIPNSGMDHTHRNAPIPFFHRCAPVNISCYAKFAEALITFVSDNSVLHRLISGVMTSKEIILGLCLLSLGGTGVLWWLYAKQRRSPKEAVIPEQLQIAEDNLRALLIYAISATVFTVILFLIMLVMRKRVALTIALFHVAGKVFIHLPLLVFQPFWTFFALVLFWVYWIMTLLFLGTAGSAVQNDQGFVEFRVSGPLQYMWWYHLVGLIWISEFILACQQMTVAGAVVTYYFTRDKRNLPFTPILASVNCLIRYHLGTVAKGSFIITLVKIPRMILMYIHSQLKGKNAYTATAINSTNFCTSAKDAFVILVENALRVAAINTVGDFMLFLGKVLIVCSTGLAGIMLLNYQQDYTVWVLPLIIVCLFAFLVAHCFLSIYEMVVDVLFLCFAVDTKYNDGSPGREFYMDKVLMEFVENSRKAMKEAGKGGVADARELKPMVGGDEEVATLHEFHFHFLSLSLFTDCTSSGEAFVICITQDVLLFLFVCLPITWMAEFLSHLRPPSVKVS
ncbi:CDW92 antigen isoform 2 isoform 2-like protein [Camelus ferus]|nr:CDW92 antigen isoform 2 isoform 2-like protein [Camelus ferus]